ncbi:fucolectin-1-like [Lingula anatina]|uniref:Fucolectin-1-like n=1 Tax=Lingula anatina TaxID=7574 RepID=A0A1S3J756_LINAN|nr:fucolectin-1-like [Lingula anatina]|eukprot:XP_013406247.1 fucolectin-1-like [Lingula anatina]
MVSAWENINLAYGKQATQSSTYMNGSVSYPADLAVDGDNITDDLKCAKTNSQDKPTWSVDLEGLYVVRRVVLIKPTTFADVCQFQGVQLCINNKTASDTGCRDVSVPNTQCSTAVLEYEIDPPVLARYVTLRKSGTQIFRLCEIIVKGYTYPYNVAIGRTAEQINGTVVAGGVPSHAIDGNVNANFDNVQIKTLVLNAETVVTVEIQMKSVIPCMESVHLAVLKAGRDIMGHVKSITIPMS